MTRKRIGEVLLTAFAHTCPNCDGAAWWSITSHRVGSLFAMYAVITAGGPGRVVEGQRVEVDLLAPPRATRSPFRLSSSSTGTPSSPRRTS